ncbi:MAG TPA: S-layer homology domain-containing protein [Hungateiclostridium thermocellum]|uniref:S-layer domain-containing protein n=1 Tax=Acetivibrio thermocellus (strain ATCC 27405 / DSM 1237 / JCM 9322 / NBRC 103400 / NCIMB 10682 / NRRL B-4536 / VPI 7372) TaxID=203119 RepID=A3DGS1_ACET2|nr:S-layer homology domain-containing protein [Acetivibrio thermocellus]CDG36449.1 S-layer-like domain-containing protein [Acetivibrio thermocellus BC1]ABN53150.1 S-layer domain-containing protein [Acetivibrio thermocellus ATCC 27405]NLU26832.1 S-layer homology domain-containing protein [Acetivibrio thermocellus]THJ78136.1 S-layer homology domain-containing protein [Acetivibrio thermocellus]UWV46541.1 S-layer homology domain-containing protein [Acetivibrio thermocellus]
MEKKFSNKPGIRICFVMVFSFVLSFALNIPVHADEEPEKIYYGLKNASTILNNINFTDVRNSATWSKEAICEAAALDIVKGYGNRVFGRTNNVTKEEAIAIIYRAAGREKDAQLAAEALETARNAEDRSSYAPSMWSDGYLQLAAGEGLISSQDLQDAFTADQSSLGTGAFLRRAPAQRQEVAYWISKVFGIEPVYGQQKIFNSFRDWSSADPLKIPYIEAVLVENIMNGEGNGYFRPTGFVTREQIAQIIKNADKRVLPLLGYEKKMGTVEDIRKEYDFTGNTHVYTNTFHIRSSNGKLHKIVTEFYDSSRSGYRNEQGGSSIKPSDTDLIVYRDGWIGTSSLLKVGDRVEYITAADGTVRYVRVISATSDTEYIVAKIKEVNYDTSTIKAAIGFYLEYPDIDMDSISFDFRNSDGTVDATLVYSNIVKVFIEGRIAGIRDIEPGTDAILTVKDNIITTITTLDLRLKEQGVISGIVEENNPHLGYISLYSDNGLRVDDSLNKIKIYNYSNPEEVTVYKNHVPAKLEDVESGDSVYIKLDQNGAIEMISAVDNYVVKYGKIISVRPGLINVAYDDGTQQILSVDENVPIVQDNKLMDFDALKDGDRVKLLLNITDKATTLKKLTVEGDEHFIANIYRGIVASVDDISKKLLLQHLEVFNNGEWERTEQKGFTSLKMSEDNKFVYNDDIVDMRRAKELIAGSTAYIAVEKDYGGIEKAVFVSVKNSKDSEAPVLNDSIMSATFGNKGEFTLKKEYLNISYGNGTIIVKDNRLVTGNSINSEDRAYVVASRSYDDGKYYAFIVKIDDKTDSNFFTIYRGRIANINENKDFTLESYSELKGVEWNYYNTPRTFRITYDTQILGDDGVVGQRDFTDYGDSSYKSRTVYVLSHGADAVLISTAPYGNINVKGKIYELISENADGSEAQEGQQEPVGFKLQNSKVYDLQSHMWVDGKDMDINLLKNSIILKDNKIIKPSELKKGDSVRLIKKDDEQAGDAYIIFVE